MKSATLTQQAGRSKVVAMIGEARWADWCDTMCQYWDVEFDVITPDQLKEALQRLYGREQAKLLFQKSKDQQLEALKQGESLYVLHKFMEKFENLMEDNCILQSMDLELEIHHYSEATVLHEDNEYHCQVDGMVCITGNVTIFGDEINNVQVYSKWISHPFWQYHCHKKSEEV